MRGLGEGYGGGGGGEGSEGEALRLDFEDEGEGEVEGLKMGMEMGRKNSDFVLNRDDMMDRNGIETGEVQNESHSDDGLGEEEEDALISNAQEETHTEMERNMNTNMEMEREMNKAQAWNLYLSHFLSTWNGRSYEFAAVGYATRGFSIEKHKNANDSK